MHKSGTELLTRFFLELRDRMEPYLAAIPQSERTHKMYTEYWHVSWVIGGIESLLHQLSCSDWVRHQDAVRSAWRHIVEYDSKYKLLEPYKGRTDLKQELAKFLTNPNTYESEKKGNWYPSPN